MKSTIWCIVLVLAIVLVSGCSKVDRPQTGNVPARQTPSQDNSSDSSKQSDKKSQKEAEGKPSTENEKELVTPFKVEGKKISLSWQYNGKPKLSATAVELTGNTLSGKAALTHVNANMYQDGKLVAKLVAPLVEADEKTRVVTATGGVTLTSTVPESTIRTVKCDWIKWYSNENKIVGNGGVKATGPVASINASAFIADTRLRNIRILANPSEAKAIVGSH